MMDSSIRGSGFRYSPAGEEPETGFSGSLEVYVHHARNIHNICIYDNQDVYAKFSLTYNPDEAISTRVIVGGGKNPEFNEKLRLKVAQLEAVLKCEIWMLSRAKELLEDQLLGFALVPISLVSSLGGEINSRDFSLSSTDLFHSPAGTVQLSLSFSSTSPIPPPHDHSSANPFESFPGNSYPSIASEVVLLDRNDQYSRVEFPDINAATEDQVMVSQYVNQGSFLNLLQRENDHDGDDEMLGISTLESHVSPKGSHQNSEISSPTTTSMSDDQSVCEEPKAKSPAGGRVGERNGAEEKMGYGSTGRAGSMDLEAEQAAMQQQIVDMYMKSMQQFTESLSRMKLPMDLGPGPDGAGPGRPIQVVESKGELKVDNGKKDAPRVFYGSRAFF